MSADFGAVSLQELLPLIGVLAVSGVIAGFAAGLLGVGGGIVTVPVLEYSLRFAGVPEEYRMHVAVATSLAAIIPTSISSARTHHARGAVDWELARRWAAPMVVAALAGSLLASRAPLPVLAGVFGSVALLIALKMLLPLDHLRVSDHVPRGAGGAATGRIDRCGLGRHGDWRWHAHRAHAQPVRLSDSPRRGHGRRSSGSSSVFPAPWAIYWRSRRWHLPWATVGFVSLVGLAVIAPGSMLTATLGARVAHSLSRRRLVAGLWRLPAAGGFADALSRAEPERSRRVTSASSKTTSMGMSGTGAVDDEAGAAQQVDLRHGQAATHGDHARHAFGQRALARGMNLREPRQRGVERRRRDQLFPDTAPTSAVAACP